MKNKTIIILVIFFIILMFINFMTFTKVKMTNENIKQVEKKILFLEYKNDIQNKIELNSFKNCWVSDSALWQKMLIDGFKNNKLCFFYSEIHCNICVDAEIKNLKKISEQIGNDKIILFVDYNYEKDFNLFIKINRIKFKTIKVEMSNIPDYFKELTFPYYFVMGKDLTPRLVFIPDKQDIKNTEKYFELISTIL